MNEAASFMYPEKIAGLPPFLTFRSPGNSAPRRRIASRPTLPSSTLSLNEAWVALTSGTLVSLVPLVSLCMLAADLAPNSFFRRVCGSHVFSLIEEELVVEP